MRLILLLIIIVPLHARTPHRPQDPQNPYLYTYWVDQPATKHLLRSEYLEDVIFNIFDQDHFESHHLPQGPISYRYNPDFFVNGTTLSRLIESLLEELQEKKKSFTHFTILKRKDFTHDNTGLLILAFKEYPFVLKLFIENPASFVHPLQKSFDSLCFFYMGGGVSRFLNGFTRIKNLEQVKKMVHNSPTWRHQVDFPRKWYWTPSKNRWFCVEGYHIGGQEVQTMRLPCIYAIICDRVEWSQEFELCNPHDRVLIMDLANFLQIRIDPHINNFGRDIQSNKIVPIDFEHFPTVVGFKKIPYYNNYVEWYHHLCCKMLHDTFGTFKGTRRAAQHTPYNNLLNQE